MGTRRKPQHTEVVLERQGIGPTANFTVAARDVATLDEAQKVAKQLAAEKPGTVFLAARLWPGALAEARTTLKFVNPGEDAMSVK